MSFTEVWHDLIQELMQFGDDVDVGEWQSTKVDHPLQIFCELLFQDLKLRVPQTKEALMQDIKPDLPWAEDHFQERVSGIPHNPPPSEKWWPWRDKSLDNAAFTEDGEKFSHTYPERYWPKWAGQYQFYDEAWLRHNGIQGIRYAYGDLTDVIIQLIENPLTRQAYLPVWFPEDTGAVSGQRVPCSLGYHFIIRRNQLHCAYYIRSCDILRHLRNDVYMTARLMQWVRKQVQESHTDLEVGTMHMHITSLHCFKGDFPKLSQILSELEERQYGAAI